ncbi:hypothetical protein D1J60_35785 (plasmid) [Streptomyces sp. W1SF4]|nr:hypothetical protein D1J60_35785 [Streptomyces sp. W1SF4]
MDPAVDPTRPRRRSHRPGPVPALRRRRRRNLPHLGRRHAGRNRTPRRGTPRPRTPAGRAARHPPRRDHRRPHPCAARPQTPTVLFGHSIGALLAHELCRALDRAGTPPHRDGHHRHRRVPGPRRPRDHGLTENPAPAPTPGSRGRPPARAAPRQGRTPLFLARASPTA